MHVNTFYTDFLFRWVLSSRQKYRPHVREQNPAEQVHCHSCRDAPETLQPETETETETHAFETETRPRRSDFIPRRDRDHLKCIICIKLGFTGNGNLINLKQFMSSYLIVEVLKL